MSAATVVTVFADGPGGGNPAPIVLDADGWSDAAMQQLAAEHGLESGFVLPGSAGADLALRFWVPNHEMEMCGHATVGALWLLRQTGGWTSEACTVSTRSGLVQGRFCDGLVEVSQPAARVDAIADPEAVLDVLGLTPGDLADRPVVNAATSRVKTLVPVADVATLDALAPRWDGVEAVCAALGSTGLYPWAVVDLATRTLAARQFPRSSGYPEDAATGIAAAALASAVAAAGLLDPREGAVRVRQGVAMGRPSLITVGLDGRDGVVERCWVGGPVEVGRR